MRNRLFAVICVLLALAMLPGGASAKAKKAPKKDIGIQLYSVRSLIGVFGKSQGDYKPVLKQLADMGYTSVEAASYKDGMLYGQTPEQFRKDVEDAGMRVISTHCTLNLSDEELASGDFSKALAWWDECIAAHKAAGAEYFDAQGFADLLPLFQRGGCALCGRRHEVRLPQPLARVREDRG